MNRRHTSLRYVTSFVTLAAVAFLATIHTPRPTLADPGLISPPPAAPAAPRWRIHIRALPDGVGAGGQRCQGCDGVYTGGDRFVAATKPLRDVNVVVAGYRQGPSGRMDDWEPVELWNGNIAQPNSRHPETDYTIVLDQPPPYTVYLAKNPDGYALCPTAPQWRNFEPKDFDAPGGRPGANRQVELTWFFWSCAGEQLGQALPEPPDRMLGSVICAIYCWLHPGGAGPGPGRGSSCDPDPAPDPCETPTAMPVGPTPVP